jgi:hypothetical protein
VEIDARPVESQCLVDPQPGIEQQDDQRPGADLKASVRPEQH